MVNAYIPFNFKEALEIKNLKNTFVFAGGTDLSVKHRPWSGTNLDFSKDIIFIGHLSELHEIKIANDDIFIGSCATYAEILNNKSIPKYIKLPLYNIGSPSIRNIGTLGGNICNSSPAGDSLPMLYALDAELELCSIYRNRTVKIIDFITGPKENILKDNEILKNIKIPLQNFNSIYYKKIGQRKSNTITKTSIYALAVTDESHIKDVRIAFGAVSPTPVRSIQIESQISGIKKSDLTGLLDNIISQYEILINPIDDIRSTKEYRKKVSINLLKDFLLNLLT